MNESIKDFYDCYLQYGSLDWLGIYIPGIKNIPSVISVQELFNLVEDPWECKDSLWALQHKKLKSCTMTR